MFFPMFALALLTIGVALHLFFLRVKLSKAGEVDPRIFKLNKSKDIPDVLIQASNNFSNLFEIPVLFYLACITAMITQQQSNLLLTLAWLFVLTRYIHSYIHLTRNKLVPRLFAFISGVLVVLAMWIVLLIKHLSF